MVASTLKDYYLCRKCSTHYGDSAVFKWETVVSPKETIRMQRAASNSWKEFWFPLIGLDPVTGKKQPMVFPSGMGDIK
jgi:hypothetical protein